jgi:hypothetical protein
MKTKCNISPSFIILIICIPFFSCKTREKSTDQPKTSLMETAPKPSVTNLARQPVIIYKTKADYSKNIPVNLSDDKKFITSYPDIKDIYYAGELAYPTLLAQGYLLDNRGIGPTVAFLDYTYEQYRELGQTPAADELMKHIIDADPLLELYSCSCKRDTGILNDMILHDRLSECKKLK